MRRMLIMAHLFAGNRRRVKAYPRASALAGGAPAPSFFLMARRGALHIGISGWHYKPWVGPFYPEGTKASAMLRTYSATFAAVAAAAAALFLPHGVEPRSPPPGHGRNRPNPINRTTH